MKVMFYPGNLVSKKQTFEAVRTLVAYKCDVCDFVSINHLDALNHVDQVHAKKTGSKTSPKTYFRRSFSLKK